MITLDNILEFVADDNASKKLIFISIGCAQYFVRIMNNQKIIDIEQDQQYPYHIRNIQREYPDYKTFLILIDKHLESPCFTVSYKYTTDDESNKLSPEWGQNPFHENVYETRNTVLIEIREFVKYYDDSEYDVINIYKLLESFNELAMCFNWFVSFMDFTGRNILGLISSFDKQLNEHANHIIYGCPTRTETGCYVNLIETSDEFIISRNEDGYIMCFNPHAYSNEDIGKLYLEYKDNIYKTREYNMIRTRLKLILANFKLNILGIYRRFMMKLENDRKHIGTHELDNRDVEYIINKYGINDIQKIFMENPESLIKNIESIVDLEFINLLNIFQIDEKSRIILFDKYNYYKTNTEIYKMYSNICELVNNNFI